MSNNVFDLSTLAMRDTFFLQLRHPVTDEALTVKGENGEDLPVGIDLYGPSSKQYRNAIQSLQSRALRRQAKKEKATPQQMEEEAINLLVAVSAGARNLGINASGLVPKTADDFRELYSEPKFMWIKDQVDEGLGDKGNFLTP